MSAPSRLGARLSSSALALVSLCVFGLAAFVDRAIAREAGEETRHRAIEASSFLSAYLSSRAASLGALHSHVAEGSAGDSGVSRIVAARREQLSEFRAVWVSDRMGVLRESASPRGGEVSIPPTDVLGTHTRAADTARFVHFSGLVPVGAGARGIVLLEPVRSRVGVAGFAGASIDSATLARALTMAARPSSPRVVLVAGADTLAAIGRSTGVAPSLAELSVPDGTTWRVLVEPPFGALPRRTLLWALTVISLSLLAVALVYERSQARKIADRSSELERLSQELLRANRAKSEFLANVSHELRTPLNAIVGFADLLRDGVYGELGPRQAGPVVRIEASANHLRHLVDQILDLAKMAAGRLEVHTETVDLRNFVFQVASEIESLVHEKGLTMSLTVGATLPRVRTDPTHLRQILVNLLGNAVKFTNDGGITVRARLVHPGSQPTPHAGLDAIGAPPVIATLDAPIQSLGHIGASDRGEPAPVPAFLGNWHLASLDERILASLARLRARSPRPDGKWIALQVADTGIGIPEKDRERIFDEFEQVNPGPRGDSMRRGTGLGLSISRRLSRLLGGDITLESEMGKGSVFTLWIPVD